jgi:hypothetical protein
MLVGEDADFPWHNEPEPSHQTSDPLVVSNNGDAFELRQVAHSYLRVFPYGACRKFRKVAGKPVDQAKAFVSAQSLLDGRYQDPLVILAGDFTGRADTQHMIRQAWNKFEHCFGSCRVNDYPS